MTIILPKESKDFELAPAGSHVGICYRIVDLGTQQVEYLGQVKRQPKIMLSWELSEERNHEGRPFSVHKRFTLSSSKKGTLRPMLEAWRGVAFTNDDFGRFDLGKLIGVPCMLGVVHEVKGDKTYENISTIMRMPKGMTAPALVNEPIYFSLNDFRQDVFDKLSEGLRAIIAKSPEYQELKGGHAEYASVPEDAHPAPLDDEIPF